MKRKYCFVALMSLSLFWIGCAKDEGNYIYNEVNTYFVDTVASMPKAGFTAKQQDVFNVSPTSVEGTSTDVTYQWRFVTTSPTTDPITGVFVDKIVGTTKDLSFKVVDAPGDYNLILYAKDNANGGVTQMIKRPFKVSGYAPIGMMVLHGNNNESDISILVNSKLNAQTTDDLVQANIFSEINGKKIPGEGAGITHMVQNWVDVFTNNSSGGFRLNQNDLRILDTYNDMFVVPLASGDVQFQAYERWSYNELLINKGDVYATSQATTNVFNRYGVKCYGQDYVAAPFIGPVGGGGAGFHFSYYGAFYDSKNRRFLYVDNQKNVQAFKALPTTGATGKFDMSNVGKDMVYAEMGYGPSNQPRWYCVLQSPNDPATRELFVTQFNAADDGNRGIDRVNFSAITDMNNAKYFAFGNKGPFMFYATDTKIYKNSFNNSSSPAVYDVVTAYPGSVITGIKLFKSNTYPVPNPDHPNAGKLLYVSLYNPTTKAGTLLQIDVNETNGTLGTIKPYTGFGKITSLSFKSK